MPIKVATDIVISNAKELQNIAGVDTTTSETINDDLVARDNKIIIRDNAGDIVKEIYGAERN